ncbi:UBP42 hydrolase, partial [Rhinopomastus cyanomelas]|nr:UBP42 hydrolase [Rhinopomastus cyanomelas]
QGIAFPTKKIIMEWQHKQAAGAGLYNLGNTCFLNSVVQCLTYTPPLANYLLSGEHGQQCRLENFCMMCIMETHIRKVLLSSVKAVQPRDIGNALMRIGDDLIYGRQNDAHEFLCCLRDSMQTACLGGNCSLDGPLQEKTIIHQIFGGRLTSRITCLSCSAVSDSVNTMMDIFLDITAASSLHVAMENFIRMETLAVFHCTSCDQVGNATKRSTIHRAPRVLTLCLKRYGWGSGKISNVLQYPEILDLRPYMSEAEGEPVLYSLYSILIHHDAGQENGHYFCYTKASNGQWYRMDDTDVAPCSLEVVLSQQAYLLFYIR